MVWCNHPCSTRKELVLFSRRCEYKEKTTLQSRSREQKCLECVSSLECVFSRWTMGKNPTWWGDTESICKAARSRWDVTMVWMWFFPLHPQGHVIEMFKLGGDSDWGCGRTLRWWDQASRSRDMTVVFMEYVSPTYFDRNIIEPFSWSKQIMNSFTIFHPPVVIPWCHPNRLRVNFFLSLNHFYKC